jgi:hypothetical protein
LALGWLWATKIRSCPRWQEEVFFTHDIMNDKPKESDWKRFRDMVPELRERYLVKCNAGLVELLQDRSSTATERFWEVEKRVGKEAGILRNCLDGHSRSQMFRFMLLMYRHQMLVEKDLEHFSEELRQGILRGRGL